tara:strand:+ start:35 stop:385 length:351 start_codon:yes stop_codon:yes gene_type:complete
MATFTGKNAITNLDYVLTDSNVNGTAVVDIFGGSSTVYSLFIEAPSGTSFLRIFDTAIVTVGTTEPNIIIKVTEDVMWTIVDGLPFTNFSYACVQENGTAGSTNPAVTIKLHAVVR